MVVQANALGKTYGSFCALKDVSFSLEKGSVLGLLGPNGAGKSTLIKVLTGYHFPSEGQVEIFEQDVLGFSPAKQGRLGYLPEKLPFYPELNVKEYLDFVAGSYGFAGSEKTQRIDAVVEQFALKEVYYRDIHFLSKGYKQRLGLAQANIHHPQLLILDEPTSGLDPHQVTEFRHYIKEIQKDTTVILSSHVLSEVELLCDQVVVLNRGRLVANGPSHEIRSSMSLGSHYELDIIKASQELVRKQLGELGAISQYDSVVQGDGVHIKVLFSSTVEGAQIFRWAQKQGYELASLIPYKMSLEDLFLELTKQGDSHVT